MMMMMRNGAAAGGATATQRRDRANSGGGRRRHGTTGEDAFPRISSPTPMLKTPVPGNQSSQQQQQQQQQRREHSTQPTHLQANAATTASGAMFHALDQLLQRGNVLRDKMSHALGGPDAGSMMMDSLNNSALGSGSLSGVTEGDGMSFENEGMDIIGTGTRSHPLVSPAPASAVLPTPAVVSEMQGRRDHIGELVHAILPDAKGLNVGASAADLVRVYAVQVSIQELNISMPSALMSQLQSVYSKKAGGHHHHHHGDNKWQLCYRLPVTTPVGTTELETFSVPINGSRLFECSGIGSSFSIRLDLDAVKVHPLLFDAAMSQTWAAGSMSYELRLGRKQIVCAGSVPLRQCLRLRAERGQHVAAATTTATAAGPTVVRGGTPGSPVIIVPLVEAEEMRAQQRAGAAPNHFGRQRSSNRSIAGYSSRKHSQGIMASVSMGIVLLKQQYALPASLLQRQSSPMENTADHATAQASRESATAATTTATRRTAGAPNHFKAGSRQTPPPPSLPNSKPGIPLFLQVHIGSVRTVPATANMSGTITTTASASSTTTVPATTNHHTEDNTGSSLQLCYKPFVCRHINPTNEFLFDNVVGVASQRANGCAAFQIHDVRQFECGRTPLSRAQRRYLAKGTMIFEFWMPRDGAGGFAGEEDDGQASTEQGGRGHFLGLAKVPLKPFYRQWKHWVAGLLAAADNMEDWPACVEQRFLLHCYLFVVGRVLR